MWDQDAPSAVDFPVLPILHRILTRDPNPHATVGALSTFMKNRERSPDPSGLPGV